MRYRIIVAAMCLLMSGRLRAAAEAAEACPAPTLTVTSPLELTSRRRIQVSVEVARQEAQESREPSVTGTFALEASEVLPDGSKRSVPLRTWTVGTADEYNRLAKRFLLEIPIASQERDANIDRHLDRLMLQATPDQRELLRARRQQVAAALERLYIQNRVGTFVLKASYRVTGARACESASREVAIHIQDTGSFIDELNARSHK